MKDHIINEKSSIIKPHITPVPLYVEPDHNKIEEECAWLQDSKVEEVFRELEMIVREICKKLNITNKLSYKSLNNHHHSPVDGASTPTTNFPCNQSEKYVLVPVYGPDQLRSTIFLIGENVCQVEVTFKHNKSPAGIFRSNAISNVQWKLSQLQDTGNYCVKAHQVIVKILERIPEIRALKLFGYESGNLINNAIEEISNYLTLAKNSLTMPRKKSLMELDHFQPTKCFHPPLPQDYLLSVYISSSKLICAIYQVTQKSSTTGQQLVVSQAECVVPQFSDILYVLSVAYSQLTHLRNLMRISLSQFHK
uniref:Protein rogdi n=1 Tax=Parastrongyloides trichosuri TaxID=131310 RepID=A0A0N4Z7E8_PARTI